MAQEQTEQNKMAVMPMGRLLLTMSVPLVWLFTNRFGISCTWYAMWISETLAFIYSFFSARRELTRKAGS